MTTVAYLGNFRPEHSTENHVAGAFELAGCDVMRLQEDDPAAWRLLRFVRVDAIVWTHTWSFALTDDMLASLILQRDRYEVPVVGFHLDRLWGLDRERLVSTHPFLRVPTVLVTADGGNDDRWRAAGIDHRWLPPAVSAADVDAHPGRVKGAQFPQPVVFVGSSNSYHPEWPWRGELVRRLRSRYGRRFAAFPSTGRPALRGQQLADLYATAPVIVGDSCLAGGIARYWSDRIPETVGRGGYLIHPNVAGLDEHFTPGAHLDTFDLDPCDPAGSFDRLAEQVDAALGDAAHRDRVRAAGQAHVLADHTYERRVVDLLTIAGVR